MSRRTTVLAIGDAQPEAVDAWLRNASGYASRVLDDKAGDGDIVWSRAEAVEPVPAGLRVTEDVVIDPVAARHVSLEGDRFLRTLFIRVRADADPARVGLLEASLAGMPAHISSIRSWSLSRLDRSATTSGWTHLWEQELEEARGFRTYMGHPYHWTGVERWFDPEVPGRIVDAEAHYLSPVAGPVITEQNED